MITGFDISDTLYHIINVATVTSLIDGKVYRERKPMEMEVSNLQNIVIAPLLNMVDFITEATVNVNIYCKDLDNGQPNLTFLKLVATAVENALSGFNSGEYFSITIVSNQLVPEENRMSFINLRLEIFTI